MLFISKAPQDRQRTLSLQHNMVTTAMKRVPVHRQGGWSVSVKITCLGLKGSKPGPSNN